MTEIVQGLGGQERNRIAALRASGRFFWIDIPLGATRLADLGAALDLSEPVLQTLHFGVVHPASSNFFADGQYVAFPFSCYIESAEDSAESPYRMRSVGVHVLVGSDYLLSVHEERAALPCSSLLVCRKAAAGSTSSTRCSRR